MDYTYVLCPNLIGVLGLSILLVFTRFNFYLDRKELCLFKAAAIINLVIIVFEVMDFALGHAAFPSAYLLRRVTSATGFALSPIFPLLLAHINSKAKLSRWVYLPAIVNLMMSYISIFTGHLFLIDQWNSYYRGPLFMVMLAISVFYMLVLICISFRNLKNMRTSESAFLICIVAIIVVCNLLEIFLNFHFLIWNGCAVLLICYYLFLHIQYFKYDPLTKVLNRNVYVSALENLKNVAKVGVISFDLDHLKKINDAEGHERGDAYIIASARLMERCFSDIGNLYRIGGDEFIVLASGTTEKTIRDKIESFDSECRKKNISVSSGYSFQSTASDLEQMLREADKAMYENKRHRKLNQ